MDCEKMKVFLFGYTTRINWLFDPWGFCFYKSFWKWDVPRWRKAGWMIVVAFTVTRGLLELKKIFRWKILCMICIFKLSFCAMSLLVSSWDIWGNIHSCQDDLKFKILIWDTSWVLGSIHEMTKERDPKEGKFAQFFFRFWCTVIWWYWNAFLSCFYLRTLWFSAKIFSCDNSSGKKMSWSYFNVSKTQQRHAVPALFLNLLEQYQTSPLQRNPKGTFYI